MNKLPILYAQIDENDESMGLKCISLVDSPAVEVSFIKFNKEQKQLNFSVDKSHRTISGVALRADYPIYRIGPNGEEYYIVFSKVVIEQLIKKYSKEQLQNCVSVNHDGKPINGVYMYEQFLINKERGICPKEFEGIEDGSLITSYYVEDDKLWEDLKNENNLSGFSVEVALELTSEKLTYNYKNKLKDMDIKKIFAAILKLGKYQVGDGTVLIYEGNELAEGTEVFIEDAEGNIIPAPDGQYGEYTVIGGIITTPEKVEEEIEEMKEEAEEAKLEEVIESVEDSEPEVSAEDEKDQIIEDLKSQIEALIAENEELKKQLEEANKATEELKKQSLSAEESLKNIETEKAKSDNKFARYFQN